MTTQRSGWAIGWKIFWGTLAAVGLLALAGAVYLSIAFSNFG